MRNFSDLDCARLFHSQPTSGLYFPAECDADILLKRQGFSLRYLFLNLTVGLLACWWWQLDLPELVGLAHTPPAAGAFGFPSLFLASPRWRVQRVRPPASCWLSCSCKRSWINEWQRCASRCFSSHHQLTPFISTEQVQQHLYRDLTSRREVLGRAPWRTLLHLAQLQLKALWISTSCRLGENHGGS